MPELVARLDGEQASALHVLTALLSEERRDNQPWAPGGAGTSIHMHNTQGMALQGG